MKRFLGLMMLVYLISCDSDNDPVIQDTGLNGEWILQEVSCFCAFDANVDFSETRLIFETDTNTLTVINEGTDRFFKESGVYRYGGQNNVLDFTDNTSYQFEVAENQLTLVYLDNPQIADDEVVYSFRRS
ncbi:MULTISPECIES: hypothetical protein [Maribacter]|uniref:Lipocalin family protein n=1 Tax=Maribacter flavus TaxID=1658664 RepID=A0A5B2TYI4_9FLAO|nr:MULTISPECIES: hypothetical protein [Maribacter]KAA2219591.1 hypothetical protein F0361_08340 [Maribacter flavus]MDC6404547.1 hypothetical protein [Maribacter sp. PR66]MEE1971690.1 hypothetical protein [Maribacter flavus]